jgi:integrase
MNADTLTNIPAEDLRRLASLLESIKSTKKQSQLTIEDYSKEYLSYGEPLLSPKYLCSIRLSFEHLKEHFGKDVQISGIDERKAQSFISHLQKKAPKGFRVYYRNLKAAFNKAKDWEYIDSNPFTKVKLSRKQEIRPTFIDRFTLQKVLDVTPNPDLRDMFLFSFYTGCRLSEVVNIQWSNIDMENRLITIGDSTFTTKSRKQRVIPICNELYELFNNKLKENKQ